MPKGKVRLVVCVALPLIAFGGVLAAVLFTPGGERSVRVLYSGESACELEVCECGGEMIGGVAHRGGFLAAREGEHLLVDVGCMGCGVRPDDVLRLEALVRAMAEMKYDAANIGEYEVWLAPARLRLLGNLGVPFVSANVTAADGGPICEPFVTVEKSGRTIAVTGVAERGAYRLGPGIVLGDPFEALALILPGMHAEADVVVVLADMRRARAREIARRFPEASLVLFRGRGETLLPARENRSFVASVAGLGRYLGEVVLSWDDDGRLRAEGAVHKIDKSIPPDAKTEEVSLGWYERAEKSGRGAGGASPERRER